MIAVPCLYFLIAAYTCTHTSTYASQQASFRPSENQLAQRSLVYQEAVKAVAERRLPLRNTPTEDYAKHVEEDIPDLSPEELKFLLYPAHPALTPQTSTATQPSLSAPIPSASLPTSPEYPVLDTKHSYETSGQGAVDTLDTLQGKSKKQQLPLPPQQRPTSSNAAVVLGSDESVPTHSAMNPLTLRTRIPYSDPATSDAVLIAYLHSQGAQYQGPLKNKTNDIFYQARFKDGHIKKYFNIYSENAWIEEHELKILAERAKKILKEQQAIEAWPHLTAQELEEINPSQLETLNPPRTPHLPLAVEPIRKKANTLINQAQDALKLGFGKVPTQTIATLKNNMNATLLALESIIEREKPYDYFAKKYTQQVIHKFPITDPKKLYAMMGITIANGTESSLEDLMPLIKEEFLEREFRHLFNNNPFGKENYDAFVQGKEALEKIVPIPTKIHQLKETYGKLRKALFDIAVTFRI